MAEISNNAWGYLKGYLQMDRHNLAYLSPYGPGLELYYFLGADISDELGLEMVDSDHPGSDFLGVAFSGDATVLNQYLSRRNLPFHLIS